MIGPQLSCYCDVISNRLWRHQQNEDRASETRGRCVKIVVLSSFMDSLCRVRNKIMYVLSWRTVSAPTRVLFWYLFPELVRNSGNKHQNNPLVSAETVRHSSAYIILYIVDTSLQWLRQNMIQRLYPQNTPCISPSRASYGMSIVSFLWKLYNIYNSTAVYLLQCIQCYVQRSFVFIVSWCQARSLLSFSSQGDHLK